MNCASLFDRLLLTLPEGKIIDVRVGLFWTAVLVETAGKIQCGLAATISPDSQSYSRAPSVARAGYLHELSSPELAGFIHSSDPLEISIGLAAINALLPRQPERWVTLHSKEILARLGADKTIVMVGHFPFVAELRARARRVLVLELNPQEGDLPASVAAEIIPQADVFAITASTLLNRTFEDLIRLKTPGTPTLIIGPSTPLSPLLFDMGATILSGAVVENAEPVLRGVAQGANLHQLRPMGVRLVSMVSDPTLLNSI